MKKLEGRAFLCLTLAMMLVIGLGVFIYKLATDGGDWASFYANQHIYENGKLTVGAIYDRTGLRLMNNDEDGSHYVDDTELRKANFHVLGDKGNNVPTAANNAFRKDMIGYNIVSGTNDTLWKRNRRVTLTIDAELNRTAYKALSGQDGFISVYNWKTGDIVCMVSAPTADPAADLDGSKLKTGTFMNKVISATYAPGSTFKLVTTAAAIEEMEGMDQWSFRCTGEHEIDGEKIICPYVHGELDFYDALAKSCNCAYASLTVELGSDVMKEYVKKLGLTSQYNVDGITTAAGKFNFDTYDINLGWAGIGQFEDQVNPLAMMVYMGAIAGDGSAAQPRLIYDEKISESSAEKVDLLSGGTARQIKDMMRNNVIETYGEENYKGLELHAKSGTAETALGRKPNSWFCGFSGDYAFVVCIEEGGYGSQAAGPAAGKVLEKINETIEQIQ
ncbi:MAG: penicillin-binding protein [Firmicutes bacterium]|nr:penicillin-binding protein [Bacillota bacterium]